MKTARECEHGFNLDAVDCVTCLRAIVEALAKWNPIRHYDNECMFCDTFAGNGQHSSDCCWLRAVRAVGRGK